MEIMFTLEGSVLHQFPVEPMSEKLNPDAMAEIHHWVIAKVSDIGSTDKQGETLLKPTRNTKANRLAEVAVELYSSVCTVTQPYFGSLTE